MHRGGQGGEDSSYPADSAAHEMARVAKDIRARPRSRSADLAARNVDYGFAEARTTTYGIIGVKVWVYNGMYEEPGQKVDYRTIKQGPGGGGRGPGRRGPRSERRRRLGELPCQLMPKTSRSSASSSAGRLRGNATARQFRGLRGVRAATDSRAAGSDGSPDRGRARRRPSTASQRRAGEDLDRAGVPGQADLRKKPAGDPHGQGQGRRRNTGSLRVKPGAVLYTRSPACPKRRCDASAFTARRPQASVQVEDRFAVCPPRRRPRSEDQRNHELHKMKNAGAGLRAEVVRLRKEPV